MYVIKKKTIRRTKREHDAQAEQNTHHIKKKKREIMVSKITFFLEKQNMKRRGTKHYVNEKEKECLHK
jgi:hypothetical protein